jgi:hypothetical protein
MYNSEECLDLDLKYFWKRDRLLRFFLCAAGMFPLVDMLRAQIAEVSLYQLVPGVYFTLLLLSWLFLTYFSNLFLRVPVNIEGILQNTRSKIKKTNH